MLARSLSGRETGRATEALMEHLEILKGVKERDAKKAEKSMMVHLNNSRASILQVYSRLEQDISGKSV